MSNMESEIAHTEMRVAMGALGLRGVDLANMVGRSPSIVSKWMNGKKPIPKYICALLISRTDDDNRDDASDYTGFGVAACYLFDWQETLGLDNRKNVTLEDAAAAKKKLLKIYHPDVGTPGMGSPNITARINLAYEEAVKDFKLRETAKHTILRPGFQQPSFERHQRAA